MRREVTPGEIAALFGAWPGSGSGSLDMASEPLHCQVFYTFPGGGGTILNSRVVCDSAQQAEESFVHRGLEVLESRSTARSRSA